MQSSRILPLAICCAFLAVPVCEAQVTDAQVKASIEKAAGFLEKSMSGGAAGAECLAAYALLKAGRKPNSPAVNPTLTKLLARCNSGKYSPGSDGNYGAGVELMLLESAGGPKYRKEIQVIVDWLLKEQHATGAWDYPGGWKGGDTSQCQYALLGFWAADRAGVKVPPRALDNAAGWFLRTQNGDGGFGYHPLDREKSSKHTMTAAGVGSLMIVRRMLYPDAEDPNQAKKPEKEKPKFGVLEKVQVDPEKTPEQKRKEAEMNYEPVIKAGAMLVGAQRGTGWLVGKFKISGIDWNMYYLYTLERMAALINTKTLANVDWYRAGASYLVKGQQRDGAWRGKTGEMPGTALGILFLTKATSKLLNRGFELEPIGNGLLAGGRGLPDDLGKAILKDGKVESTQELGPLDELLAELEKVENVDVGAAQKALVEKVTLGDREDLIQQKDRIIKLAKHPSDEVRRTAIWALGRTEDLKQAKLLLEALDDNNIDVIVEARNALCIMSRKPLGFGLPETPFANLPGNASDEQKQDAVKKWRKQLKEKWGAWYYAFRPYEERDDLSEALFGVK